MNKLFAATFVAASVLALGADSGTGSRVEVAIQVTATSFNARNYSDAQQVLLFRNVGQELVVARTIPAGAEFLYNFPRHALEGVEVEVVSVRPGSLHNSGVFRLDQTLASDVDAVWIQRGSDHSIVWLESSGAFEIYSPAASLVPEALLDASGLSLTDYGSLESSSCPSTHVPVITPSDRPIEYGPPVLEDEPLPPV